MILSSRLNKDILKFGLLITGIVTTVVIQSVFLSLILFLILIAWDRRFIIPILLFVPAVETIVIATPGLTITKLLSIMIGLFLLVYFVFKKPNFGTNAGLFSFFICLTLLATLYGMMGQNGITASHTAAVYFLTVLPKLLFALLLYLYVVSEGITYLKESLEISVLILPMALIIITIYFIWWGFETSNWWHVVTRQTFEGADPNEFGGILSTLAVFPLYCVFHGKNKALKYVALLSIGFIAYSVSLTLSRGAILTFLFMVIAVIIITTKFSFTATTKYAVIGGAGLLLLIQFGVIDLYAIQQRFTGIHVTDDISSLTAGRSTVWKAGLEAFIKRPLFGYGNSKEAIFEITNFVTGRDKVLHNMYLEILMRMGLVGFITFIALLVKSQTGIIQYLKYGKKESDALYILPLIALLVMGFSALGLSWQWRELWWYLIAISLATSKLISVEND